MASKIVAVCSGCGRKSDQVEPYSVDPDLLVEEDGTYKDGKFVCDECYCGLIDLRTETEAPDIGSPEVVQENARRLLKGKKNRWRQ